MIHLLLLGELTERVAADGVVALGHAQGAAALAGDAGEALPSGEVVDGHLVEADILPAKLLLPLQDGGGCGGGSQRGAVRSTKNPSGVPQRPPAPLESGFSAPRSRSSSCWWPRAAFG